VACDLQTGKKNFKFNEIIAFASTKMAVIFSIPSL
jgi:hypothetical protein